MANVWRSMRILYPITRRIFLRTCVARTVTIQCDRFSHSTTIQIIGNVVYCLREQMRKRCLRKTRGHVYCSFGFDRNNVIVNVWYRYPWESSTYPTPSPYFFSPTSPSYSTYPRTRLFTTAPAIEYTRPIDNDDTLTTRQSFEHYDNSYLTSGSTSISPLSRLVNDHDNNINNDDNNNSRNTYYPNPLASTTEGYRYGGPRDNGRGKKIIIQLFVFGHDDENDGGDFVVLCCFFIQTPG